MRTPYDRSFKVMQMPHMSGDPRNRTAPRGISCGDTRQTGEDGGPGRDPELLAIRFGNPLSGTGKALMNALDEAPVQEHIVERERRSGHPEWASGSG